MVSAFRERLLAGAQSLGRSLSEEEIEAFSIHYRLLKDWSRRMNLTGLKDMDALVRRHFLEPIAASDLVGQEGRLVDLGSGNGFPAIPLKVLRPRLELILVEASEKKSSFLWAVLRGLRLEKARVETRHVRETTDLVDILPCKYLTLRAIQARRVLKGRPVPILEPGGRGLFFLSAEDAESLRGLPVPGLHLVDTRPLPGGADSVVAILEPAIL
ncbi:MAG TPA: RsmG family class I SAM-dependent methyltransferase [Candidatus Polarisedimenticolia bacterium]|jgi:16S rRNA (guanine527-N7)-methyltransferase|nr:RsmG family class I SAM-dependent methyltransferase [Candidatus Polarisedimenticolia bacterium]